MRIAFALVALAFFVALLVALQPAGKSSTLYFSAPAITESGSGVMAGFSMTIKPGTGRLLVDINSASYKEDVENSLRKAMKIVEREEGVDFSSYDLELESPSGALTVSGESAGAMFTIAMASAITGRRIKGEAAMSAGVNPDGTLFPIDGTPEKINAAIEAGKREFFVAWAQKIPNENALRKRITITRITTARQAIESMLEEDTQ